MTEEKKEGEVEDARVSFISDRLQGAFKNIKQERFRKSFNSDDTQRIVREFLESPEVCCLVVSGDSLAASHALPKRLPKGKAFYFMKTQPVVVTPDGVRDQLVCGEMTAEPLVHLEKVLGDVYLPLLSNVQNQEGWGEIASKDVVDRLQGFLASVNIVVGHTRGETCLPLPVMDTSGAASSKDKEKMHLLDTAVITWTKQIKNVLKLDPESLLKLGLNPTPDVEIEFWKAKAANLNSIYSQLRSERIKRVLKFLDAAKSTYCAPFLKLEKEVRHAREEANDNVKYLRTLEKLFSQLNTMDDFEGLKELFKPMMHIILTIWKSSRFYNTSARLVVLMREICNALIAQACRFISGEQVFQLIESEEAGTAVEKLKTTLKVCGTFKSTYFDFKAVASTECPSNPWRIQNNALFMRLDSFLERCHDILDLTQTIVQFNRLGKIEIGGTKGKTLTTSVQQIFADFQAGVAAFQGVSYDIMDVSAKEFDDDFYEFRCRIKELERRLGSVLTQGFDDCAIIYARFKLLDSFEGLLERPIIQDELEKKHVALVEAYNSDLKVVQETFIALRDDPPIAWNLPHIAGALAWCRGLRDRIVQPMEKLLQLNRTIMEREEAKDAVKVYGSIMETLTAYEEEKIKEWSSHVEDTSQTKLKLPLLGRDKKTTLLRVNFDPELVSLLREVKYFLLMHLEVPKTALDIYKKAETYRRQTGNLDLIVNMYNNMITHLLPVEAPLMKTLLTKIDKTVATGINEMNWKSHSIDAFIGQCQTAVRAAHEVLFELKGNLKEIESVLEGWAKAPLLERKMKPVVPEEFEAELKILLVQRYNEIKEGGQLVHKKLKASNAVLKVSKGHPDWRAYVDFVNDIVVEGLGKVVEVSLMFLGDQLDPELILKHDKLPMLEIAMNLYGRDVMFEPKIEETADNTGVRDIVNHWVDAFYRSATLFKRLDDPEAGGNYVKEVSENMMVRALLARINDSLSSTEDECISFRGQYERYSYLWCTDLHTMLQEFLEDAYVTTEGGTSVPDLAKFDAAIAKYREEQVAVAELKTPTDIGWLRINSQPIQAALATWVTKWVYAFTQHLQDYVTGSLSKLHDFIEKVDAGLATEVPEGDKEALKLVMGHIRDVRKAMDETADMFGEEKRGGPLKDTVMLLRTHGISLEGTKIGEVDVIDFLENAPLKWTATINATFKKKEEIMPLQNAEVEHMKEEVERFFLAMRKFRNGFRANAPFGFQGPPDEAYAQLDTYVGDLADMESRAAALNEIEELFELPVSKYPETVETRKELGLLKQLWDTKSMVASTFESWRQELWTDINTEDLEDMTKKILKQIRAFAMHNQIVKGWQVYRDIEEMVKVMAVVLPLVNELHSPAMRDRHWKSLSAVCHVKPIDPKDSKFCLDDIIQLNLHKHIDDVSEIVETAVKELKIEKKMQAIEEVWTSLTLDYVPHKDTDVRVVRASDEVVESLEAHQMELQTMIGMGKFVDYFRDRVTTWQKCLGNVESTLKEWLNVSKSWAALESIFLGSADIRAQLPDDTKRFEGIDQEFKDLMKDAVETPNVVEACNKDGREEALKGMSKNLELCQKSLNEYLDMKKKIFPRFYFVSNVALLDILSNGNNPPKIMPYAGDCYDSIKTLSFRPASEEGKHPNVAFNMIAKDGEVVEFASDFVIEGAVENWLNALTRKQVDTLAHVLEKAVETAVNWEHDKPRHKWLFDYPSQIVLVGTQIFWTEETQQALEDYENGQEDSVKKYFGCCNDRLSDLISLVMGKLSKPDRTKIISLITMDVHGRDTVQRLIDSRAEGPLSFLWQQQLRFNWAPETKDVNIAITDFRTKYSYEWVGNSGRLVITPLTDRCYITLTLAMRLMLGGAPAGPAGTGKTETTKDLARALALPCYVFNCSDQMNYQTMADIFKGLSQTGAWGCFDEFNRIPIEVLSVVATQVKSVLDAIVLYSLPANREEQYQKEPAGQPPCVVGTFELMGDPVVLIPTVGFFITMNPGYAGRTELPENLKALFRSCAMIRPDLALICENMLLSEGFVKARPLSIKFVTLYFLACDLLSPQAHYDWGLRAVKSVLRVAGALKRSSPDIDEEAILMRALRDFNTPKITTSDTPIFLRLIQDLFPTSFGIPTVVSEDIKQRTTNVSKMRGLQSDKGFVLKVVQFQELLDVRHSVMLIGPAGCGKSTIWKTLLGCHNLNEEQDGFKHKATAVAAIVNPKAVTSDELYGYMTLAKEWKDGNLSIIMRGMSRNYKELGYQESQTYKWVVLDGDIDAVWIESMNTVMDDNKVLTLVSNERVPLSPAMRMVFEISSLENATPATVSRAGMLYINEGDIGWRPFVESWISRRTVDTERANLPGMFDKIIDAFSEGMRRGYKEIVPLKLINKVMTVCALLDSLLPGLEGENCTPANMECLFAYACIWAFGGPLVTDKNTDSRKQFQSLFESVFSGVKFPPEPKEAVCYDWYFNTKEWTDEAGVKHPAYEWEHWSVKVPEYVPVPIGNSPGETQFSHLVVSTVDSVRLQFVLDSLVDLRHPVMLVGTAGTGKTTLIKDYLRTKTDENQLGVTINANYYMDSKALQIQLMGAIDKRSGRVFGPPPNKKLIYFVDDINLPYKETYGTQNALELLRQVIDHASLYDRADLSFLMEMADCQYVSAMNPTAGSFTINERLQRHFSTFATLMPAASDLQMIYSSILKGHLSSFPGDVPELYDSITNASIALHEMVSSRFLPSATKFVYNWNMRELSNIFQGICLARPEFYPNQNKVVRLWLHEASRVFGDRLVSESDQDRFNELITEASKRNFEGAPEELWETPNIHTSFAVQTSGEPAYLPIPVGEEGMGKLRDVLEQKLAEYNEANSIMSLVLFEQAMQHVCRITRIIGNPSGNAMLVGVGGSGKQSLSRLAASICGFEVRQLPVTSKFTVLDLKEHLMDMYKAAGVKGTGLVFLLTDSQIVDDKFLVYVNDMLSSGWIADLFPRDELDSVFGLLRNEAKAAGIADTPDTMLEFFISRVKRNLHIVLCFSPVGDTFRVRARRFPGLINCTSIDWFHAWPRDALVSVAARFLIDVEMATPEIKENCAHHMAEVHLTVSQTSVSFRDQQRRHNYVTPKSFLELISFYKSLLAEKRGAVGQLINRLDTGLSTLRKTAQDVAELQVDLTHTMAKVEEKKNATDALLEQMGKQRGEAEAQQEVAEVEAKKASEASAAAEVIEKQASGELAEAKPAMDAAASAVDCLSKASLTELRSLPKPPAGVDKVTACCLMMIENEFRNHKWDRAKKMMAKVDAFLIKLKEYKAENMSEQLVSKLEAIVNDPSFTYEIMLKKSSAAANLCSWVINTFRYNRIYIKVKPLMDALNEARGNRSAAEAQLAKVQKVVAEVEARLQKLQESLLEATNEKMKVEAEAAACQERLSLAERLVNGLSSENKRWGEEIEKLREEEETLVGDVLLASAFISYIGAFDSDFRNELWRGVWIPDLQQREIPLSDGADPLRMLTDDGKTAQMMSEGLPADRISVENGAIVTQSKRWPLLIDPQLQAIKWLRKREEDNNLIVVQMSHHTWLRQIESAIQNGFVVLVENMGEEIDATLNPVLAREVYKKGRNLFLKLGGEEVEYDPNFRLYLQTKLSNPHYKPEIQAQCCLINFIATEKGLEDQLLARCVNIEKAELEEEKQKLAAAFNTYKIQLLELENQLLERLANAPEDILSDVPLIEGLEATKLAATEINKAVEKGKITEIEINKAREVYRPVASEGAMLYFLLTQLSAINHMYQYSLDSFVLYFYKAIHDTEPSEETLKRVDLLRNCLRLTIYTWVSRGLFESDKLILQSQVTFQLMRRGILKDELVPAHFDFLIRGPKKLGEDNPLDWLQPAAWNSVQALADLEEFTKFPTDLVDAAPRFREWFNSIHPESEKLPLDWAALDKTPFLKLLVLRCLRPDRLTVALSQFVRYELPAGDHFVDCDATLNSFQVLEQVLSDSKPFTPIYFILSPGADVVADVDRLAAKQGLVKGTSYHNVSMGQGQDVVAMEKLELAHKQGHWVILNNVHLMPRWLVELEKKLDEFAEEGSHESFRVFLTSDPNKQIPIGVLNRSIKLTNEPPTGLKANLKRAFCSFSKEKHDELETKTKAILFGLCHFHAVMIERKKFGPKGFNMMYPFSLGDLRDSATCLINYMENAGSKLPWEDLRYIFGQIMYGGHIVNDFDRLLCVTYLDHFLRDELLDEMELFPFVEDERSVSFKSPSPTTYDRYLDHIEENFKGDTPLAFGLHPNAEIGFRTEQSETLFRTLQELQPREASGGEMVQSPQHVAENILNDILERFGETRFDVEEIDRSIEEKGPFQNVFLQECDQMNTLLVEVARSLHELNLGFAGELTMSDDMETIMNCLFLDRIPPSWAKLAWPSLRPLASWLHDMSMRIVQLQDWVANPLEVPRVTWLSGLINPQSFLTAVMQQTAQAHGQELDKLVVQTDVTKKASADDVDAPSRDGAYISGLFLQGARWDTKTAIVDKSLPREMYCPMPVINVRAVSAEKGLETGVYKCPVYKTESRGPTFVFRAQLRTKSPPARWIMAGVALICDIVE
jgi:dynein heavy chain